MKVQILSGITRVFKEVVSGGCFALFLVPVVRLGLFADTRGLAYPFNRLPADIVRMASEKNNDFNHRGHEVAARDQRIDQTDGSNEN